MAMQIKFVAPWMLSGACDAARTEVLADVMNRHSLVGPRATTWRPV